MHKILFICHGNICRSPMAEMILKHLVRERGLTGYVIDSAAEIEAATTKAMYGTGKVELAQISVDEVLALCLRNNPEATYAQLKDLFHSEQVTVDWLLK